MKSSHLSCPVKGAVAHLWFASIPLLSYVVLMETLEGTSSVVFYNTSAPHAVPAFVNLLPGCRERMDLFVWPLVLCRDPIFDFVLSCHGSAGFFGFCSSPFWLLSLLFFPWLAISSVVLASFLVWSSHVAFDADVDEDDEDDYHKNDCDDDDDDDDDHDDDHDGGEDRDKHEDEDEDEDHNEENDEEDKADNDSNEDVHALQRTKHDISDVDGFVPVSLAVPQFSRFSFSLIFLYASGILTCPWPILAER